jgi:hypothetical protein
MTPARFITVVSGVPRSGTSLVMQMLVAGGLPALTDDQRRPDADNPRGYFEFEAIKRLREDKSWLAQAEGRAVKVIHLLVPELPDNREYRVVFVRRDLREVVRSQAAMLARAGRVGGALPPERLIAVFEQQIANTLRWLAGQPACKTLEVPHAGLLADSIGWARQLNAFLGGQLQVEAMAGAVEPALYRNRSTAVG